MRKAVNTVPGAGLGHLCRPAGGTDGTTGATSERAAAGDPFDPWWQ